MKKKLLIVSLVMMALVTIIVLIFTLVGNENNSTDSNKGSSANSEATLEQKIFSISNYDEFKVLAEIEKFNVYYSKLEGVAEASEFDFLGFDSEMSVFFDKKNNIEMFNIYFNMYDISELSSTDSEIAIEEYLYNECYGTIDYFANLFGVQYSQNIQLTNYDGTFCEVDEASDLTSLLNEESYINFAVHDTSGHYYVLQISMFETILEAKITKYYDVDSYIDYFANISLYEE